MSLMSHLYPRSRQSVPLLDDPPETLIGTVQESQALATVELPAGGHESSLTAPLLNLPSLTRTKGAYPPVRKLTGRTHKVYRYPILIVKHLQQKRPPYQRPFLIILPTNPDLINYFLLRLNNLFRPKIPIPNNPDPRRIKVVGSGAWTGLASQPLAVKVELPKKKSPLIRVKSTSIIPDKFS